MIWITADDVIRLHALVIQRTGGLDGLRDRGALAYCGKRDIIFYYCSPIKTAG